MKVRAEKNHHWSCEIRLTNSYDIMVIHSVGEIIVIENHMNIVDVSNV